MRLYQLHYAGTCKSICSYNLYNFLTQLLPLKSLVFVVHLLNAFWHGNQAFSNGSSQNEIVPLLVVFHLPYSKYKGVKMFLHVSLSKSKFFTRVVRVALVSHLCCTHVMRVSLVLHSCRQCHTRVAFVLHVPGTRVVNQTRSSLGGLH